MVFQTSLKPKYLVNLILLFLLLASVTSVNAEGANTTTDSPVPVNYTDLSTERTTAGATSSVEFLGNEQIILRRGNPERPFEQEVFRATVEAIAYMEELWEVRLNQPVELYIYDTVDDFKEGIADSPVIGKKWSNKVGAAVIDNKIFINKDIVSDIRGTIYHEIVHVFQNITEREPCFYNFLIESYAYYIGQVITNNYNTTEALANIRWINDSGKTLPNLIKVRGLIELLDMFEGFGDGNMVDYMVTVTDFLLTNYGGHKAIRDFFLQKYRTDDFEANFKKVFGLSPTAFQKRFNKYSKK